MYISCYVVAVVCFSVSYFLYISNVHGAVLYKNISISYITY